MKWYKCVPMRHTSVTAAKAAAFVSGSPWVTASASSNGNVYDCLDGALAVRLQAAEDRFVVGLQQVRLADVIGAALGTEDQEPVEPVPIVDLPHEAAVAVDDLTGVRDRGVNGESARPLDGARIELGYVDLGHCDLLRLQC
jgi:hypothetical protein